MLVSKSLMVLNEVLQWNFQRVSLQLTVALSRFAPRSAPTRLLGIGQKELVLLQEMKTTLCGRAAVNKVSFKGRAAQRAAVFTSLQVLLSVCFSELSGSFKPRPIKKRTLFTASHNNPHL